MVKIDLGTLFANHVDHTLAHVTDVKTRRCRDLRQSHSQSGQVSYGGEEVAFLGELIEHFRLCHYQPLIFLNSTFVYFKAALNAFQNIIDFIFHLFFDRLCHLHFDGLLNTTFNSLLEVFCHLLFYAVFYTILYAVLDSGFHHLLHVFFQCLLD